MRRRQLSPFEQNYVGMFSAINFRWGVDIRECDEHSWTKDRADPHARERTLEMARRNLPPAVSPEQAVSAILALLDTVGDSCPECPPEAD